MARPCHTPLMDMPGSTTGWNVSRETGARLSRFLELLEQWNRVTGLISKADRSPVTQRHVADSLALIPLMGDSPTIADLGSGGGLPGLVLAIATDQHITLIEANQRKAAFLREAIRATGANASVVAARIETLQSEFSLITARGVAPLTKLLGLVSARLAPDGRCLFLKGRNHAAEIAKASVKWDYRLTLHASATEPDARILEISDIRPLTPVGPLPPIGGAR